MYYLYFIIFTMALWKTPTLIAMAWFLQLFPLTEFYSCENTIVQPYYNILNHGKLVCYHLFVQTYNRTNKCRPLTFSLQCEKIFTRKFNIYHEETRRNLRHESSSVTCFLFNPLSLSDQKPNRSSKRISSKLQSGCKQSYQ